MKIFITGEPGVGKTTLLKNISLFLKEKEIPFSGFITEEIRREGKRIGFKIVDLETHKEEIFADISKKTPIKFGKYFLDIKNFESIALKVFSQRNIILIDEIGKMEFFSKNFRELLFKNIEENINLIATLHRDFVKDFKKYGEIFNLSYENRRELKDKIINILLTLV